MQFPKFDIFASKEFVETLAQPKKAVRFTPQTNFAPGRSNHQFHRIHPQYVPGKHSCPAELGGEWENTSKMTDLEYQLLYMIIHSQHCVRDEPEAAALSKARKLHMKSGHPLPPGSDTPLILSKFKDPILVRFRKAINDPAVNLMDEFKSAKVLTVYKDHDGEFKFFQFLHDPQEEEEAREWLRELKTSITPENIGIEQTTMLRLLREA
jgi:hypothetical protein